MDREVKKVDSLCRFFTEKSYFYRKDGGFVEPGAIPELFGLVPGRENDCRKPTLYDGERG